MPHEYVRLLEEQARRNRIKYLNRIEQETVAGILSHVYPLRARCNA